MVHRLYIMSRMQVSLFSILGFACWAVKLGWESSEVQGFKALPMEISDMGRNTIQDVVHSLFHMKPCQEPCSFVLDFGTKLIKMLKQWKCYIAPSVFTFLGVPVLMPRRFINVVVSCITMVMCMPCIRGDVCAGETTASIRTFGL